MIDKEFIKIPVDFKSLHDLQELTSNYDLISKLSNALTGYQRHYIDSYVMSFDEVLKHIPEEKWDSYTLNARDEVIEKGRGDYIKDKWVTKKVGLVKNIESISPEKDKVFLINHVNKKVDICPWFLENPKKYYKGDKRYNVPLFNIKYNNKIDFGVNLTKKILIVKIYYSYKDEQAVGGVWINGRRNGYLSGHSYVPYTINGYDIYHFCTKTNKYLGYKGFKEDPQREWQEIKSRY